MIGMRFGRLTVIELHSRDGNYNKRWSCVCDCGQEHVALGDKLKNGRVQSCGCLGQEMRDATQEVATAERRPYTRKSYFAMVTRCTDPDAPAWERYGARGIGVCDRWLRGENGLSGWQAFFADMGPRPHGTSIDRIDGTKGYFPGNCRWATREVQNANRRKPVRRAKGG